jgi:hypothetical protein
MNLSGYRAAWLSLGLTSQNHEVTSPETADYNCVAWALGQKDVWIWPGQADAWWPAGIPAEEAVQSFEALFVSEGYEPCSDGRLEAGFEKLTIYSRDGVPTHVARQVHDGSWTSKLGSWEDISHTGLEDLEGGRYGRATSFMRRALN